MAYGSWDTMQIYNTETDTWSSGTHLPQPRAGMATIAFNGRVYMIAGGDNVGHNEVFIYDPVTDSYTTGAPMPDIQGVVAGVLFNGEIYVVGGWDAPGAHYVYNPTTNTWRTIAPLPTTNGKCLGAGKGFVLNNAVWIVGCGTWIYDPDSDTWRQGPSNNVPRVGSSAELFNGRGFVVGGGATLAAPRRSNRSAAQILHQLPQQQPHQRQQQRQRLRPRRQPLRQQPQQHRRPLLQRP